MMKTSKSIGCEQVSVLHDGVYWYFVKEMVSVCFLIITSIFFVALSPLPVKYLFVWLFILCPSSLPYAPEGRACVSCYLYSSWLVSPPCQVLKQLLTEWMCTCRKASLSIAFKDKHRWECRGKLHRSLAEFLGSVIVSLTFNNVTLGNSFNVTVPLFSSRVKGDCSSNLIGWLED